MSKTQTVEVPLHVFLRLQDVLADLERLVSPYQPEFVARMYRARASDLEGKGKPLSEVKRRFQQTPG
jgi:hypothetical protein